MPRILVLHGPNLNMLGIREPDRYGAVPLSEIDSALKELARSEGITLETFQSNSEGELVGKIQGAIGKFDAIVINPAAYTHTSIAIRDAILAVNLPTVEVHLSNIHGREVFRRTSLISDIVVGQISGFGFQSYLLGLRGAVAHLESLKKNEDLGRSEDAEVSIPSKGGRDRKGGGAVQKLSVGKGEKA